MNQERLRQAIRNNALWCDTVCRSHGNPGEFLDEMWLNCRPTPRFYPNAVTLSKDDEWPFPPTTPGGSETRPYVQSRQLARIHDLVDAEIPGECSVKDSFHALDLAPLGFRILFEAEWIWAASLPPADCGIPGVLWAKIADESALAEWEVAWGGEPAAITGSSQARIFLPALLADERVAIIAAYRDHRIVAGVIANRGSDVVGVSNLFVPAEDGERFRAVCVASVMDAFPGLLLAGYEAGRDLAAMRALGFEALGPLRVWVKR